MLRRDPGHLRMERAGYGWDDLERQGVHLVVLAVWLWNSLVFDMFFCVFVGLLDAFGCLGNGMPMAF